MTRVTRITIGHTTDAGTKVSLDLKRANRHGLITGVTGSGKTTTLQRLIEGFSTAGVPVFAADIKGDLSGISTHFPTRFWDVFAEQGLPIKAAVEDFSPPMLARLLNLNQVQEGNLAIAYRAAREGFMINEPCLNMDLDDLCAWLREMRTESESYRAEYGNVTAASVGAIENRLQTLIGQGLEHLFGEPAFDIADLMRTDEKGRGVINLLSAERLVMNAPDVYGVFLLYLLRRLRDELPEAGDLDKPKLVFFFDEAHLLFAGSSKPLLREVENIVRLIRSKGVGVYFVTQRATDVPENVLAQLGNRVQHALRAFTPKDLRDVNRTAETFRPNPAFDTAETITSLGVGEALVSVLEPDGSPSVVQKVRVMKPSAQIGPISWPVRQLALAVDPLAHRYTEKLTPQEQFQRFKARMKREGRWPQAAADPGGERPSEVRLTSGLMSATVH